MHKNTDFHIEQTRLNDTYRKLNSGNDFSSYINEQENQSPTYWSFLKLRIGFSILFLFFLIACFKTAPAKEFKKVQSAFSHINQTDSYSEHILNQFDLNLLINCLIWTNFNIEGFLLILYICCSI